MSGPVERPRRIQQEAQQQTMLSRWARLQWWAEGYFHHEAATESWLTARKNWAKGVRGGWPDVTVMVPELACRACAIEGRCFAHLADDAAGFSDGNYDNPIERNAMYLALELKRDDDSLRPKRRRGQWWLAWARELRADDAWHIKATEPTRHGLSARQALRLKYMHRCGWVTYVAYGFDEARAWLEEQIGPRSEG